MLNFFRANTASQVRVCNRCYCIHNKATQLKLHGRKTAKTSQQFYSTNDRGGGGIVIPTRGQSGNRAPLELSTGKLARLADGCAVAKLGNTSVMTTAVCTGKASSLGFFPLTVDYRQKASAAGRIPTNFLRREMGVTEREILTGRMIDRSIRPLFPKNFNQETGISCNLLSVDGVYDPEVLSVNGASAALAVSGIPWGPVVGAARVAVIGKSQIIVNPTRKELAASQINMVVAGTAGGLATMIESESKCLEPDRFVECVAVGLEQCAIVAEHIEGLAKTHGKPKRSLEKNTLDNKEMLQFMAAMAEGRLRVIYTDYSLDKQARDSSMFQVRDDVVSKIRMSRPDWDVGQINEAFTTVSRDLVRSLIFDDGIRVDGRGLDTIRPISCEVDLHQPLHGSALFQRGQTQVFCTVALDSLHSAMKLDPISVITGGVKEKNFMLHYEFPGYATGELSRGGFNRREMGHGALAEKALKQVVPDDREFAMRLTSEVLESNGSSSMASICGGSLALLDAGIPLSESASGVAMGLVTRDGQHKVLTDIMGMEDFLGDMDFKFSSTRTGVTALQADVKIPGISLDIIKEAVEKGVEANNRILDIMEESLKVPRKFKDCWPVSKKIEVPPYKRGKFLGTAGINLRRVTSDTGVQVNSEEEGVWTLFAPSPQAMDEAEVMIKGYLEEEKIPELIFGSIYTAKILEILEKGVMIQLHAGIDPILLHNSQLSNNKVGNATALGFEVGQDLQVKYYGRDPVTGNIRISRKVLTVSSAQAAKNLHRSTRR